MSSEVSVRLSVTGQAQVRSALDGVQGGITRVGDASERLSGALARVGHYTAGVFAAAGLGNAVRDVGRLADEYATLNGRLRTVTASQSEFARAQLDVAQIAEKQRKGLTEIGTLYASASAAASELGASQAQIARFTEGVAAALTVNGTSAQAASGALLQLSQAIGGSVVQAQEFNSLIDGARPLLVAAAKHIDSAGGSVSKLKELVNQGKISSREFFEAVVAGSDELVAASATMPVTIGQAVTRMRNDWMRYVGALNEATGASNAAGALIAGLSKNLDVLAVFAGTAAAFAVGKLSAALVTKVKATAASIMAMQAESAAATAALAVEVRRTEAIAIHTGFVLADARAALAQAQGFGASLVAQNAVIAASARHTAALAAQTAAQTALNRATGLGAAALGLLGGPIGLAVTALGVGAVAWTAWAAAAQSSNDQAAGSTERSTDQIIADLSRQAEKLEALARLKQQPGAPRIAATAGEEAVRLAQLGDQITALMQRTGAAANLNEVARQAILQATLKQYAALAGEIERVARAEAARKQVSRDEMAAEYLARYATAAEKLSAALKKAEADFGGLIPPDIERRIRASFEKPANDTAAAYRSLARELGKLEREQLARAEAGGKLSASQQLELNLTERLNDAVGQLSKSEAERFRQTIAGLVARERAAEADRAQSEAAAELDRARQSAAASMAQQRQGGEQLLQNLRDQYIELTAGRGALEDLIVLRLEDAAATHEQRAATLALFDPTAAVVAHQRALAQQLREQIALRRGIASATASRETASANADAAARAVADWQRASDQIGQALTDALMAGGKNAGEYIKGLFRAMVLRPVIQAAVNPIAGALTSALGFSAPAQAAGAAGGFGNLVGMAGLAGSLGAFGTGAAYGAASGLTAGLSGAAAMMGAGNVSMGLGAAAGAAAPWLLGAMAVHSIAKSLDKSGTPHMGSVVGVDTAGQAATQYGDRWGISRNIDKTTDAGLKALTTASVGSLNALSQAFGGAANYAATARFAADNTDPSIGQYLLTRGGQQAGAVGPANDFQRYATDRQEGFEAFALDVARATRAALDAVALPQWARGQLAALGDESTIDEIAGVVNAVASLQQALQTMQRSVSGLGGVFVRVAGLGGDALKQLADFAGGVDALHQQTMAYVQNYYSRDEIAGIKAQELVSTLSGLGLDVSGLSSRDQFRALVDQVDVGNEAGRRQLAALLGAQGTASDLFDYLSEAGLGGTLGSTAGQAPEMAALGSLFSSGANEQVAATNQVRDSVDSVADAVNRLITVVQTTAGQGAPTIIVRGRGSADFEVQLAEP